MTTSDSDKIQMALSRLALFEQEAASGEADIGDFIINMRLRLEHGSPGDTIACFAMEDSE